MFVRAFQGFVGRITLGVFGFALIAALLAWAWLFVVEPYSPVVVGFLIQFMAWLIEQITLVYQWFAQFLLR